MKRFIIGIILVLTSGSETIMQLFINTEQITTLLRVIVVLSIMTSMIFSITWYLTDNNKNKLIKKYRDLKRINSFSTNDFIYQLNKQFTTVERNKLIEYGELDINDLIEYKTGYFQGGQETI